VQLDAMIGALELHEAQRFASEVETSGFDGLWITEGGRPAYPSAAASVLATERLQIGTGVALAFPRSPFVTAGEAWALADAGRGRFLLGLGTQVKGHIERRYAVPFSPPGPRLREYVQAVRRIWASFQTGEPLQFEGEFWPMSIGPLGQWTAGPIEHPDIPILLAGVQPWMLRMIGAVADGLYVHPFHSERYLREVIDPAVTEGARAAGRDPATIQLVCPVMTIVGDTDEELESARRRARAALSFHGSTRAYRRVFEIHGWTGLPESLYQRQRAGDLQGMADLITDDMLDMYAVTASWDGLAGELRRRYGGLAHRLVMYSSGSQWREDPAVLQRWAAVAGAFHLAAG
jgi:probable F420-dependent oxidoreductase